MITYNEKEVPVLRGETDGRTAVVLSENELANVKMNVNVTVLKEGAIIEFLDKLIVKQQKRRATDTDYAPKNTFILMNVDGKQRWVGLGTFTRRNYNTSDRAFISPISKDIPEDISILEFYNTFKQRKFKVDHREKVETNVFTDAGVRTAEKTMTEYPVLVYAE